MLKYACHKAGIDFGKLRVINVVALRTWTRRIGGRQRAIRPATGALPAAARGRWGSPHRCAMRPEDRTCRFLEPGGETRLAAIRHRQGVHARLDKNTRLYAGHSGERDREGREIILPVDRCRCPSAVYRELSAAGLLDFACRDYAPGIRGRARCLRAFRLPPRSDTCMIRCARRRSARWVQAKPDETVGGATAHWGGNARRLLPHA